MKHTQPPGHCSGPDSASRMRRLRLLLPGLPIPLFLLAIVGGLMVFVASAVRLTFLETPVPYITFYPAVILAALYGGLRTGLLATVLSACLAGFFGIEPVWRLAIKDPADGLSLVIFLLTCTTISWMIEVMRRAQARALRAEAWAHIATERQRVAEVLRESEERHRIFFEMGAVGRAYGSLEGRILRANTKYWVHRGSTC